MKKTLSIPEWHRMAAEGNAPPVRIMLEGISMHPAIRINRDYVTVVPLDGTPVAGDIVLFRHPGTKRYVMHRVWAVKDGRVLTWGDNCSGPDGWMAPEDIWGKAVLIERGKRNYRPDPRRGMRWAAFWHRAGRFYRFARQIAKRIRDRIRKILRRSSGADT